MVDTNRESSVSNLDPLSELLQTLGRARTQAGDADGSLLVHLIDMAIEHARSLIDESDPEADDDSSPEEE
jgi:hypothetical protein